MTPDPLPIDQLTRADEPAAVASLAAAFVEYPLLVLLCPDAARRPRVTEAFCRFLFRMALRCDGAFGTPDRAAVVIAGLLLVAFFTELLLGRRKDRKSVAAAQA